MPFAWSALAFAVAVGFPEREKRVQTDRRGRRIAMPCVTIVAENTSSEGEQFTLYSELEEMPKVRYFSGISGGPIFWSQGEDYGLLGIVGAVLSGDPGDTPMAGQAFSKGPRLCIRGIIEVRVSNVSGGCRLSRENGAIQPRSPLHYFCEWL
jgi:hypothetical protein